MSAEFLKQQVEGRQAAWHEAKHLLDTAAAENRDLTAEEREQFDRINMDLDERAKVIETVKAAEERESRIAKSIEGIERVVRDNAPVNGDKDAIRALVKGDIRSHVFGPSSEQRDVFSTATGAPIATDFYREVMLVARYQGALLDPAVTTHITTEGGNPLQIPSLSSYSAGTVFSQGSAIGESDPVFNSFVTLNAHKLAFITQYSMEMMSDAGVDIVGFIAEQTGNAIGYSVNSKLTTGTGTVEPTGIMTSAGSGVRGTAAGGAFSTEDLVNLVYSVDAAARNRPGAGFLANASTIAKMRTLTSPAGYYVFSPAVSADQRDLLLGFPVHEQPQMASVGSAAKSVAFGDLKSFTLRIAGGGLQLDRSDEFAFNQGLVTMRAQLRIDSSLVISSHVKTFQGA